MATRVSELCPERPGAEEGDAEEPSTRADPGPRSEVPSLCSEAYVIKMDGEVPVEGERCACTEGQPTPGGMDRWPQRVWGRQAGAGETVLEAVGQRVDRTSASALGEQQFSSPKPQCEAE